jgi:hypothetical protein
MAMIRKRTEIPFEFIKLKFFDANLFNSKSTPDNIITINAV